MQYLVLFFAVIAIGFIFMGLIGGGLFVLFLTGVLYMSDIAIDYLKEEEAR